MLVLGLMLLLGLVGLVVLGDVVLGDVVLGIELVVSRRVESGLGIDVVVSRRVESLLGISGLVVVGLVVVGLVVVGLVVVGLVVLGLVVVGLVVLDGSRLGAVVGTSLVTRVRGTTSPVALPVVRGARVVSRVVGCWAAAVLAAPVTSTTVKAAALKGVRRTRMFNLRS